MPATAEDTYDVVILGGGSGGYACAFRAAELGLRVALVEKAQARRHLPARGLHPDQGPAARRRGGRHRPRGRAVRRAHAPSSRSTWPASTPTRTASSAASTRASRAWPRPTRWTSSRATGRLVDRSTVEVGGPARHRTPRRPRHRVLPEDPARPRDRWPGDDERAGAAARPRPRPGRRARWRRHRRRVRLGLPVVRLRGHRRRGAAAARRRRGRGRVQGPRAGLPQAQDHRQDGRASSPAPPRRATSSRSRSRTARPSRPTCCSSPSAAAPSPTASGTRRPA